MELITTPQEIVFYLDEDGQTKIEVHYHDDTIWLTQKLISQLFDRERSVITKHINNIFKTQELDQTQVCAKFAHTASDGKTYNSTYYSLDVIIAVGYRVNSKKATRFRQWATKILKEFIIKGFVLNDEMLKNGRVFGKDYFDELLERIREIRASERRFYQKITDLFSTASYDYNKNSDIANTFYAEVQNKLEWAITGYTAPELIANRVDSSKANMGLQTWKNAPHGKIYSYDITVAKNYLKENEISELNRVVNMLLDYAENVAERKQLMSMQNWIEELDRFLEFNRYKILEDCGKISREFAEKKARREYKMYKPIQDSKFISDFDMIIEKSKEDK